MSGLVNLAALAHQGRTNIQACPQCGTWLRSATIAGALILLDAHLGSMHPAVTA